MRKGSRLVAPVARAILWTVLGALVAIHPAVRAVAQMMRLPPSSLGTEQPLSAVPADAAQRLSEKGSGPFELRGKSFVDRLGSGVLTPFRIASQALGVDGGRDDCELPFQFLPEGLIYKSYLAGVKQSRLSIQLYNAEHDGWLYDATLGGRFGLFRYGTSDRVWPAGFQLDIEGSAQVRLDIPEDLDVRSADYRAGVVGTWGTRWRQTQFGYYHLSSHLGDEFLMKNPLFSRIPFARDALILGHSIYVHENVRIYAEAGWAFSAVVSQPWEFQFGIDYAPAAPTGICGAPFLALNGSLREEVNFGGSFSLHAGWAWRGDDNGRLFRMGLYYFNGESAQFSFYDEHEHHLGFGIWFDA